MRHDNKSVAACDPSGGERQGHYAGSARPDVQIGAERVRCKLHVSLSQNAEEFAAIDVASRRVFTIGEETRERSQIEADAFVDSRE